MRKALRLLAIATVLLVVITLVASAQGGDVNESLSQTKVEKRPLSRVELVRRIRQFAPEFSGQLDSSRAISCYVRDSSGAQVTTVYASHPGDQAYWLYYSSGGTGSNTVTFIVIPYFEGTPLTAQVQVFGDLKGSTTNIITPFGIPYWGADATSGYWILVVANDSGESAYSVFEVVP